MTYEAAAEFIVCRVGTGRRKPMVIAWYGPGAASKLIFSLASSVGWIVGAKAIDRVGKGIRGTPRDAPIADVTAPELILT